MTKASDNPYPSLLIVEGTEPAAPSAGQQRLYIDSTTHHLMRTDSGGTEVDLESGTTGGGGTENLALNAPYTLNTAPSGSYPDAPGERTYFDGSTWVFPQKLTDGIKYGGYTGGAFVGWDGTLGGANSAPSAAIDLGAAATVEEVRVYGTGGVGGVVRPNGFTVEHSDDNSSWTQDFDISSLANTAGSGGDNNWCARIAITPSSHRYWRVTAKQGGSNFTFLSEIELWGTA